MTDVAYEHHLLGASVLSFDGRVVENFTFQVGSAGRLILGLLHVSVDGPDRKGRTTAKFTAGANGRGGGFHVVADEANWALIEPLVREIEAAAR